MAIRKTGQAALSHTLGTGDSVDLLIDWLIAPGRPREINTPAEDPVIEISNGWIEEQTVYTPLSDAQIEILSDDGEFMARLISAAEEDLQARAEDAADLRMGM